MKTTLKFASLALALTLAAAAAADLSGFAAGLDLTTVFGAFVAVSVLLSVVADYGSKPELGRALSSGPEQLTPPLVNVPRATHPLAA